MSESRSGKYWLTATAGAILLAAAGTGVFAISQNPQEPALAEAQAGLTSIPTAQKRLICPSQPQLVSGVGEGTDAAFAPSSSDEDVALSIAMVSDLAGTLPWVQLGEEDQSPEVSEELQQGPPAAVADSGQSERTGRHRNITEEAPAAEVLTIHPLGRQPGLVSSVRTYEAEDGDLAGLAAADCVPPRHEQWVTGMTSQVGATAVLHLNNPTQTTAVANLDFYGHEGRINAPGAAGIVLAPNESRSFLVAGFAPDQQSVTARVRSTGGAIAAFATQNYLFGLTPGGTDYIVGTAGLARQQTVTGFLAQKADDTEAFLDQENRSFSQPALIITSPAASDTEVTVTAYNADGEVGLPNNGTITVPAQGTVEMPLDSLAAGTYSFSLEADNLITAATRTVKGTDTSDVAYQSSNQALGATNVVALPRENSAALVFGQASGESTITIHAVNADGKIGDPVTLNLEGAVTERLTTRQLSDQSGLSTPVGALINVNGDRVFGQVNVTGSEDHIASYTIRSTQQANTAVPVSLSE